MVSDDESFAVAAVLEGQGAGREGRPTSVSTTGTQPEPDKGDHSGIVCHLGHLAEEPG